MGLQSNTVQGAKKYNWEHQKTHGLGRRACVLLVLSTPPQKPHFFTLVGWTGFKCTSRDLLESSPTSGNTIGAGQGNML